MGLAISKALLTKKKPINVVCVGLDYSGKTTILYKLKINFNKYLNTIPTVGFNVETINYKKNNITIWDIGGQTKNRCLWEYYYQNVHAIIFVIDSSDRNRIHEAKDELYKILHNEDLDLTKIILLIIANKQDIPNAMKTEEITQHLELSTINNIIWYIKEVCALTGEGLEECLKIII